MKRVAVLMTVHNRREMTLCCLHSLYACSIPEEYMIEVFMTNDGCIDGTPEVVGENYPSVHIIKGDGSLYWNRGMWTAWNEAAKENFDFYLWLNDDTYLYSNALELILNVSSQNDERAIIVGATENSDKTRVTYGGWKVKNLVTPKGYPIELDFFNGNVVLIPKAVFHILGNLDFTFRHSKGDFDYGLRAKKLGIKSILVGLVIGQCDLHASLEAWCNPNVSLKERLLSLKKPTGMNLKEFFYFDMKHKGLVIALFHVITISLHCIFPRIWKNI